MNRRAMLAVLRGEDRSMRAGLLRAALAAAEPGYRLGVALRNSAFDRGWRKVHRLGRPTISVGNITTGGTGKTPMAIALCQHLAEQGHRPAVLLRGYAPRSASSASSSSATAPAQSDEAEVLREALAGIAEVESDADRVAAAGRVERRHPEVSVYVLDDAFQHRRVQRDLDLVLIDALDPFGGGRVLPRGLLREPKTALRRADAVIVTHSDQVSGAALAKLDKAIAHLTGRAPAAHAVHAWDGLRDAAGAQHEVAVLEGLPIASVCGLGHPEAFEAMLARYGAKVVCAKRYDDHYAYGEAELGELVAAARSRGAQAIVTSEKDWVKWRRLPAAQRGVLPIYRPMLTMRFRDGEEVVAEMLARVERRGRAGSFAAPAKPQA